MAWTADEFLKKRYEAGFKVGYAEGRAKTLAKALKFFDEHPDATVTDLRDFLLKCRPSN